MEILKKLISVLIASCFVLSIVNLPVYSAQNTIEQIGTAQNQEEYNLQADYKTVKETKEAEQKTAASAKVPVAPKATTVSSAVTKVAKQAVTAINKLLNKKGVSKLAKTWLKKLKTLVNNIKNGKQTNTEKKTLLNKALAVIKKVTKAKGSDLSLAQQTVSLGKAFSVLKTVLKNNLTYKIYSKYSTKGLTVIKTFAKKLKFKLKTVYNQFVKYGVTKSQMKKAAPTLLKLINSGITCCASFAVSKYLKISDNFAALQLLAADMQSGINDFIRLNSKMIAGYCSSDIVLRKNGKKAEDCDVSLKDFMNNLKVGQKAVLYVNWYDRVTKKDIAHAIGVVREKSNKYAVYDTLNYVLSNNGKVTYTTAEFKKFLNGKSAKGKNSSGKNVIRPVYLSDVRYKFIYDGKIAMTTDSKNIKQAVFKKTEEYKLSVKITASINKLLQNENLSGLAKTWLKKAKTIVSQTINSSKSLNDKYWLMTDALNAINSIKKENASILSLAKISSVSKTENGYPNIFYSLRNVLKDNTTYKLYTNYGDEGISLVKKLSDKFNLSVTVICEQFIKNKVNKNEIPGINDTLKTIEQEELYLSKITEISDEVIKHYDNLKKQILVLQTSNVGKAIEQLSADTIAEMAYNKEIENNAIYKIYAKYGDDGKNLIKSISDSFNLNIEVVYKQFINNGVTKEQMRDTACILLKDIQNGGDIFTHNFVGELSCINNILAEIKNLAGK